VWNDITGFAGGMFVKRETMQKIVERRPEPFQYHIDYDHFPCKFMTEDGHFVQQLIADGDHQIAFDYSYKINHYSNPLLPRDMMNLKVHYSAPVLNLFTDETRDKVLAYLGYSTTLPTREEVAKMLQEAGVSQPP
jgi:hypothetical protein